METREARDTTFLQIGDLAKAAGTTIRTVRYYEEQGLMRPSGRSSAGLRLYTLQDLGRLRFLRRLKALGFSIEEIKEMVGPQGSPENSRTRVARTLEVLVAERARLERKLRELEGLRREVDEAASRVTECRSCSAEVCPAACQNQQYLLPE